MKNIYFLFFVIASVQVYSQTTTLKIFESNDFKEQVPTTEIVGMHSSKKNKRGIIKYAKDGYFTFDVFSENLEPLFSQTFELEKKETALTSLYFENEIKVLTVASPKKKIRKVYCYIFNIETKSYTKTLLFEKVLEKQQTLFDSRKKRLTSFAQSPNGEYMVMITDNVNKTTNSFTVHVYNATTLKLLYKKDYEKDLEKHFNSNDIAINDSAVVYVVGKQYLKGKMDKSDKKANYEFIINRITKEDNKTTTIDLEDEFVSSLSFANVNEKLMVLGFYSNKSSNKIKGGCSFILDSKNLEVLEKKKNKLPPQVYEGLYGYRNAEDKKDKELNSFYIDHVIVDKDLNTYVVAEEFYITTTYVNNGMNGGSMVAQSHYDDVLVLKFNSNGDVIWGNSIFKRAFTPSYNAILINDHLHVILNSGKNLLKKDDGRTKVSKGWFESSSLYDIEFNTLGEPSYNKVQDNKGKAFYLPAFGTYTSDGSFIMINRWKKSSKYRKLMLLK